MDWGFVGARQKMIFKSDEAHLTFMVVAMVFRCFGLKSGMTNAMLCEGVF